MYSIFDDNILVQVVVIALQVISVEETVLKVRLVANVSELLTATDSIDID